MKRYLRLSVFPILPFAITAGLIAAACAGGDEEAARPDDDDAGEVPPPPTGSDSGDIDEDASTEDAGTTDVRDGGDASAPRKTCTVDDWCHTDLPDKPTLRGVWGDGEGVVWSVTEQGAILRWDGSAWSVAFSTTGTLRTIWGSGPTDIWVGGEGGLFHGQGPSSAALSWTQVPTPNAVPILSIWGSGPSDVWAVGNKSRTESYVLHYEGGPADPAETGWAVDPVSSNVGELVKVWGYGSDVWVAGQRWSTATARKGIVYRRIADDAGVPSFQPETSFNFYANFSIYGGHTKDANRLIYYGIYGNLPYYSIGTPSPSTGVYSWTDGLRKAPGSCASMEHFGLLPFSDDDLWLFGAYGRLCHWDGSGWTISAISIAQLPFIDPLYDAWAPTGTSGGMWVVGKNIAIYKKK